MRKQTLSFVCCLIVCSSDLLTTVAQKTGKIVGGPLAVKVTNRAATIAWIVQPDEVTLRPSGDAAAIEAPVLRTETVTLTSLKPNTRYEYNISSAGEHGDGSFKTPPAGSEPLSLLRLW